jgi:phage terminase small subunit
MKLRKGQLTERQRLFCEHYVGAGRHNSAFSARLAGYAAGSSHVTGCQLLQQPKIAARVHELEAIASQSVQLDRARVLAEMVSAAQMAKDQQSPMAMISAWRELGRLMGYYAPARVDVDVRAGDEMQSFEAMSNEELMAIVQQAE